MAPVEPPIKTLELHGDSAIYGLDSIMEHIPGDVSQISYVLVFCVDGQWMQEIYQNVEWGVVRHSIAAAVGAAGVVWVTLTNGWCLNMVQDLRAEDFDHDDDPQDPLNYFP